MTQNKRRKQFSVNILHELLHKTLCQASFILKISLIPLFSLMTYLKKSKAKCYKTRGMWLKRQSYEPVWSHTPAIPAKAKSDPWVQGQPGLLRVRLSRTSKNFSPLGSYSTSLLTILFWTQKLLVLVIIILKVFSCIDKLGTQSSQGSSCLQHLPLSLLHKKTHQTSSKILGS